MVRGSLNLVSLLFVWLQLKTGNYLSAGWITGIVVFIIGLASVYFSDETYHKDLDYIEGVAA
jgi:hypothetical protein